MRRGPTPCEAPSVSQIPPERVAIRSGRSCSWALQSTTRATRAQQFKIASWAPGRRALQQVTQGSVILGPDMHLRRVARVVADPRDP